VSSPVAVAGGSIAFSGVDFTRLHDVIEHTVVRPGL